MEEWKEFSAKTADEALTNALTGGTYSFLVSMMEEN